MRVPIILFVVPFAFGCQRGAAGKASQTATNLVDDLCVAIVSTAESMPIPERHGDDHSDGDGGDHHHQHGDGHHGDEHHHGGGGEEASDAGEGNDDFASDDDDEGDDHDGDHDDDHGGGDNHGDDDDDEECEPPAAMQRVRRLADTSEQTRANAARQILSKGPRFSDAVLLSATSVSGDLRDSRARPPLARVVLGRFDRCPRPLAPSVRANAALALGLIADNPQMHGHRWSCFGGHGHEHDEDEEEDDDAAPGDPDYVYWTLAAAACAVDLDVRHAGVRGLGQLRDERARPLLEAMAEEPGTGDDVQDALLSLSAQRSLTTIFPSNSVTPGLIERARDGLDALRESIVAAEAP